MKIAAWSDGHGTLPELKEYVDIMIIAGDFVPLYKQRETGSCLDWFTHDFFEYVKNANCKKVILVPGNHDFMCEYVSPSIIKEMIDNNIGVKDKLIYLVDEEYEYKGLKFYGCPWCTGPFGWAFSPCDTYTDTFEKYDFIPADCDVLITHQPPKIDKLGCSNPYMAYERDFGSAYLRDIIDNRNIKYHFCGHIHTGIHNGVPYGKAMIYNVSLKNEDYRDVYEVTYIEI